jgi:hypothetical protein
VAASVAGAAAGSAFSPFSVVGEDEQAPKVKIKPRAIVKFRVFFMILCPFKYQNLASKGLSDGLTKNLKLFSGYRGGLLILAPVRLGQAAGHHGGERALDLLRNPRVVKDAPVAPVGRKVIRVQGRSHLQIWRGAANAVSMQT